MPDSPLWDDPCWVEPSDNVWQRRLRRHQVWWREVELQQPPGHIDRRERPVGSMLTDRVDLSVNLWTEEARAAYKRADERLRREPGAGLIQESRLRRNLLSSQPLCFNLFGYIAAHPDALLPWVQGFSPDACAVTAVELECSPVVNALARSAFDAYVTYETASGDTGFLGIESKYAEDLTKSQRGDAAEKFVTATQAGGWKPGAEEALDHTGLRQFWYNTLLAQQVERSGGFSEGRSVVVALADDSKAVEAVKRVSQQLEEESFLAFSSVEKIVASVTGHDAWKDDFERRYLRLEPSA